MSATPETQWSREDYDRAAQAYLASLPPEHFREATTQSAQRAIIMASLALLKRRRGGLGYFGELLVQYWHRGRVRQVVPDNMLVLGEPGDAKRTNWPVALESCPILWVLEYVSKSNMRKDYEDSFAKYERELKVPYYLLFYPDNDELSLYRRGARKYASVKPNERGRYAVDELEVELGSVGGWVRYWFRGEMLPIPVEAEEQAIELRRQLGHVTDENERLREQVNALLGVLRPLVEAKARLAGRQDILSALPGAMSHEQLTRWLAELG